MSLLEPAAVPSRKGAGATPPPCRRPAGPTDGRHERSRRTRQALLDAFVSLAGRLRRMPSAQELSDHSGRSLRIVFDRFPSLDDLAARAVEQLLAPPTHDLLPRVAGVERDGRIAFHVQARAATCEGWRPAWPVIADILRRHPDCAAQFEALARDERRWMEALYAPELRVLPGAMREHTLRTLDLVLGIEAWTRLREQHGLSIAEARAFWHEAIDRLL